MTLHATKVTNETPSRRVISDGRGRMVHFFPGQSKVIQLTEDQILGYERKINRGVRDVAVTRLGGEPDRTEAQSAPIPPDAPRVGPHNDTVGLTDEARADRARALISQAEYMKFPHFKMAAKAVVPTDLWPGGSTLRRREIVEILRQIAGDKEP